MIYDLRLRESLFGSPASRLLSREDGAAAVVAVGAARRWGRNSPDVRHLGLPRAPADGLAAEQLCSPASTNAAAAR
jgi:hypothetical protein